MSWNTKAIISKATVISFSIFLSGIGFAHQSNTAFIANECKFLANHLNHLVKDYFGPCSSQVKYSVVEIEGAENFILNNEYRAALDSLHIAYSYLDSVSSAPQSCAYLSPQMKFSIKLTDYLIREVKKLESGAANNS